MNIITIHLLWNMYIFSLHEMQYFLYECSVVFILDVQQIKNPIAEFLLHMHITSDGSREIMKIPF